MEVWDELSRWKAGKSIEKELHFTKLGGQDISNVEEFFKKFSAIPMLLVLKQ